MEISPKGVALIKEFEGLRLDAYLCPAGILTVGYGHVVKIKDNIGLGQKITQLRADLFLRDDLRWAEKCVVSLVNVRLNQNQFDALVSLAFNIGQTNFHRSTLLRVLNSSNYTAAANNFTRWVYAGKKKLPGLVRRREAERLLFVS